MPLGPFRLQAEFELRGTGGRFTRWADRAQLKMTQTAVVSGT